MSTDPLADLSTEERQALADLAEARAEGRIGRRGFMALAAGVGVGGAAGALGTGTAAADASTSDSDGNVGLPGDPVDVFADEISAELLEGVQANLSSFDTLQDALDHSSTDEPIFVDGTYQTDETLPINPPKNSSLVGIPGHSKIEYTDSESADFISFPDISDGYTVHFEGFALSNNGSGQQAITHEWSGAGTTWFNGRSSFKSLTFSDWDGTWTFEIENAYSAEIENLRIIDPAAGGVRLANCNASEASRIQVLGGGDGATPAIYVRKSDTRLVHPYVEDTGTDAAIQFGAGGEVSIDDPYIEGGSIVCGIQLGDGDISTGNTGGSAARGTYTIDGALISISATDSEAVRLYNVDSAEITGAKVFDADYAFAVGDSNHESPTENVQSAQAYGGDFSGASTFLYRPTNNEFNRFIWHSGKVRYSTPTLSDMEECEVVRGIGTGGSGVDEIYYKTTDGRISRWTADGTITS